MQGLACGLTAKRFLGGDFLCQVCKFFMPLWVSPRYFDFLPKSKDTHVRLTGDLKLARDDVDKVYSMKQLYDVRYS